MAARVLNIEISDLTVSVCFTAKRGRGLRVFKSFVFPTPEGCFADGMITDPELLARALKSQLTENGLKRIKNVIFSIASSRIAVREVKLPPMKRKLMGSAIATNAGQYFPIDLTSYRLSHDILERPSPARPFYRVLVLATPLAMLTAYAKLAEKAGLSLRAIDTTGNSQYQLLKLLDSKGVSLYADIGSSGSSISFIKDGVLLLQRSFAHGPDELLTHYMAKSGRSKTDYLQMMRELDSSGPDFAADQFLNPEEIYSDLERLSGNITRAIDYFASTQWGAGVSRIVLTGLNRHIIGLRDIISEATGIETLYLDDIHEFSLLVGGTAEAAGFTGCIGSSLASLDLNPEQSRLGRPRSSDGQGSLALGVISCLLLVAAAGAFAAKAYFDYHETEIRLQALRQEVEALRPAMEVYHRYSSYLDSEADLLRLEQELTNPNEGLTVLLNRLEERMPTGIRLLSASFTKEGGSLGITASGDLEAAALLAELRSFEGVAQVDISELGRTGENGSLRISFNINIVYGVNPYLNGLNPYAGALTPAAEEAEDISSGQQ